MILWAIMNFYASLVLSVLGVQRRCRKIQIPRYRCYLPHVNSPWIQTYYVQIWDHPCPFAADRSHCYLFLVYCCMRAFLFLYWFFCYCRLCCYWWFICCFLFLIFDIFRLSCVILCLFGILFGISC